MKLKKLKIKKYELIKLHLLKSRVYKNSKKKSYAIEYLNKLKLHFKKILRIIYQYHVNNKVILFLGFPYSKNKNLLNNLKISKHYFIPEDVWVNGFFINKHSIFKYLNFNSNKSKNMKSLLNIKVVPDLIVMFKFPSNYNMVKEILSLDIPIVCFEHSKNITNKLTYIVQDDIGEIKIQRFYKFLIYSIVKKPKRSNMH